MRVVVAWNDDAHLKTHLNEIERIGEEAVAATAREIAGIVGGEILPVRDVKSGIADLRRMRPDLVINLCEGVGGKPHWEMHWALAMEMLRIPFTGCDPLATGFCIDKALTKKLLQVNGIDVPRVVPPSRRPSKAGETPAVHVIVKPSLSDAGIGIDAASVCTTDEEIAARVRFVEKTYGQPALVEEFIDGREFSQAIFYGRDGIVLLPPGEIIFHGATPRERLVGWKAKWADGSKEDLATVSVMAEIDAPLRNQLAGLCRRAAEVLSLGGPARFDVRQRPSGELCILDVNPNPDIGAGSGFRKALDAAGITFPDFLDQLMMAARSRRRA